MDSNKTDKPKTKISNFSVVSSSTLATAAGGALIGSALGGPVGSVIGAVSGASVSLVASAIESHKAPKAKEGEDA